MRLLNVPVVKDYKAGEKIITEEETDGEELFIILSGKVKLHKDDALHHAPRARRALRRDGARRSLAALGRRRRPRRLSRALVLRRRDFYEIIRKEPVLATKLLWSFVQVLTERLRKTTADLSGARLEAQAVDSLRGCAVRRRRRPPPHPAAQDRHQLIVARASGRPVAARIRAARRSGRRATRR